MKKTTMLFGIALALSGVRFASATIIYGTNLVPNGDFETSNVYHPSNNGAVNGFVSDYVNIRDFWNLTSEGVYAIANNPSGSPYGNPYFPNGSQTAVFGGRVPTSGFGDHTTGSGLMMVVNGASDTTKAVWQLANTISVTGGLTYRFQAWTSTFGLNGGPGEALASMRFQISLDSGTNWQSLGTTAVKSSDPAWVNTYLDGTFASSTNVLVRLMNNQPAAGGNDFALDDIFFGEVTGTTPAVTFTGLAVNDVSATSSDAVSAVPEPGQVAASLLLLGGIGAYVWVKRRKAASHTVAAG